MTENAITKEISDLLGSCKRPGMGDLINWLKNETDFFTAPASVRYHGNHEGGLAVHSLNVYDSLVVLHDQFADKEDIEDDESLIIVALLHDVCKTNYYVEDHDPATSAQMNYANDLLSSRSETIPSGHRTKAYVSKVINMLKNNPTDEFPTFTKSYRVDEELPLGHGEKSLYLVSQFILLMPEEALAIRWHLGMHEVGTHFHYPTGAPMQQAVKQHKLVPMMISADYLATWMVDITI